MREFNSAPLEVRKTVTGDFQTQPYECGWASEAIFFITIEKISGDNPRLTANVQLSNDGVLNWADEGSRFEPMLETGFCFLRVKHFGGWLRLNCNVSGTDAQFRVSIQLALKE
jgi:hypothetical protein